MCSTDMKPMRAPRCRRVAAILSVRPSRRPEQQIVDHRLVGVGDVGDRRWQRVHDMEVRNREQLGLALGQPLACRCPLALRTMPVPAAVVADDGVPARASVLAARNMAAEPRCSAAFDRRHHLHLAEADVPRVGATPRGAVVAEDVRNLQSWTLHDPRPLRRQPPLATSSGPLTWVLGRRLGKLPQLVERAHDAGDHAGRNTRVARCRLQLVVSEKRLDCTNIHPAIEQMRLAKLCRSECRFTAFLIPAASAVSWNSRLSCRVVNG